MPLISPDRSNSGPRHHAFAGVRLALRWTAWLLVLNLGWELAQLPLYSLDTQDPSTVALYVAHCTLGDGVIALGSYIVAAAFRRDPLWPTHDSVAGLVVACVASVGYTAWSEWRNVYVASNWAYAAVMPTIAGIGLTPLLQWILLPPTARWLLRQHVSKSLPYR
jgi:hypothetical protein